ncbi:hypothetical protein GCM10009740_38700 [Terrabacter terrae]|uniref:Uncharacterized protein n=2 Tax=Terrabacter terrae TaxID=318434 RepID=A0ABN1ZQR1_9MICO
MALPLTHFVAGAVVAPLSVAVAGVVAVVVAVLAVSRLVGGHRTFARLDVGASTWAGPGLESWTVVVRARRVPGWLLPMAGGCVRSDPA